MITYTTPYSKNFWLLAVVLAVGLLVIPGCGERLPDAMGTNSIIRVVADSTTWSQMQPVLDETFGKTVVTPQTERYFQLQWADPKKIEFFKKWRNVIFVTTLDRPGITGNYVTAILAPEALNLVRRGEAYIFHKQDIWAKDQQVVVLVSTDMKTLQEKISSDAETIFEIVEEAVKERVKEWLYSKELSAQSRQLLEKYGWAIRIPAGYGIAKELPEERFVWIKRTSPDRWIFVYWEPATEFVLSEQWLMDKRDEIGQRFYEGDAIVRQHTRAEEVNFQGYPALKLTGLWENRVIKGGPFGGPFRSYGFYDASSGNRYIVDIAVFAAGIKKAPYLRQLEIIAHTFSTTATTQMGFGE